MNVHSKSLKKRALFVLCGQYTLKFNHQLLLPNRQYSFTIIMLFGKFRVHPWAEFILNEETGIQISNRHLNQVHHIILNLIILLNILNDNEQAWRSTKDDFDHYDQHLIQGRKKSSH